MFRVTFISPSFYPAIKYGGPIYSSLNTCEELAKLGVKLFVSTTNANVDSRLDVKTGAYTQLQPNLFVKYYNETIVGQFSLDLFLNLWRDIRKSSIVHIQAVFNTPIPIALLYAKVLNKPIVYSPRGALSNWGLKNKRSLGKKIWINFLLRPFINKILWHVTSETEKKDIFLLFPQARIKVIPNGITLIPDGAIKRSRTEFDKKFVGASSNFSHYIVSMGRLHKVKGFDILIKSFSKIKTYYPQAALLIAGGDDGELDSLKKLSEASGLTKSIFFPGNLQNMEKFFFLSNADLFVLPSHTENFGNVYAEALSTGTPIVASTNAPWEEVEAAGCGRWVPNTVEATTEAMLDLLSRDQIQLRQNALKYVQKFDWKNIALQFKELYEEVLNGHDLNRK